MRQFLRGKMIAGIVIGGVLFNAAPAFAEWPTFDAITHYLLQQASNLITKSISNLQDKVTNIGQNLADQLTGAGDSLNNTLKNGFTQQSNYAKAQVGAMQQITDASNTAMASYQKSLRNVQIRDDHTLSPSACMALNMGQTVTVAAGQAWRVRKAIDDITDRRGQGLPGTPAFEGAGQAAAAITQLHLSRYCSETEAQAGLCTSDPTKENLDQRAGSMFGVASYDPNGGVDAANDFATNVIQPVVPAASRGDGLTTVAGQDAEARRRSYNAKMSLARGVLDDVIASRTNSVNLTADEKQQQANQGLPQTDQASWFGALELEVNRRAGGVEWAASLQAMPPKSVMVEIASELATSNYIALANLKLAQQNAVVNASLLATAAQAEIKPSASMPSPQMASQ